MQFHLLIAIFVCETYINLNFVIVIMNCLHNNTLNLDFKQLDCQPSVVSLIKLSSYLLQLVSHAVYCELYGRGHSDGKDQK